MRARKTRGRRAVSPSPQTTALGEGIAGIAFETAETINVLDASKHPRFKPEVDAETGYCIRNILAMPIVARDGRRLGVMQTINKRYGLPRGQKRAAPGFGAARFLRLS